MKKDRIFKFLIKFGTVFGTVFLFYIIFYIFKSGLWTDNQLLINKVKEFGSLGPIIFVILGIVQVIFPVIPGGAYCLSGVLIFGPIIGFLYNYISLCIGSIIAFLLSKKHGLNIIKKLFKNSDINKYLSYIDNHLFDKIFFWGILIPGAPDDLLCYLAGLTTMSFQKFLLVILFLKPVTLVLYSVSIYYLPVVIN